MTPWRRIAWFRCPAGSNQAQAVLDEARREYQMRGRVDLGALRSTIAAEETRRRQPESAQRKAREQISAGRLSPGIAISIEGDAAWVDTELPNSGRASSRYRTLPKPRASSTFGVLGKK